MFIWQLILNALGLLVLVIICGFIAIAVKSFIKELKKITWLNCSEFPNGSFCGRLLKWLRGQVAT